MSEFIERVVQDYMTEYIGQVWCSDDPHAHDLENLPCKDCGAAL